MRFLLMILVVVGMVATGERASGATFAPATVASWRPSLLDGLVAYWPLDESSGARYDAFGTNHLTDFGTLPATSAMIGNGITNSAANKYLTIEDVSKFTLTNNFTVSFWGFLNNTNAAGNNCFFAKYNVTGSRRSCAAYTANGLLTFVISTNGSAAITTVNAQIDPGTWNHYVFTVSNQVAIIVTNGVLADSMSLNSALFYNATDKFTIGALSSGLGPLAGKMDEFAVHGRPLLSTEIQILYNQGRARRFPFNSGP
jgi:hypothetical protein